MAKPQQLRSPPSPWATLRQAVLWIESDLLPIEPRLEVVSRYPESVSGRSYFDGEALQVGDRYEEAKDHLACALMLGVIKSYGRATDAVRDRNAQTAAPHDLFFEAATSERSEIPKQSWQLKHIDFDCSYLLVPADKTGLDLQLPCPAYVDVRVRTTELLQMFPSEAE